MSATPAASLRPAPRGPRPLGRVRRLLFIGLLALVVVLAGYGAYSYLLRPSGGEPTLVIYTYDSFLGGGCGANANASALFGPFESAHGVHLKFECPGGTLSTTLEEEKNAPVADLVVGLDEVTTPQAEAAGVLVPYTPPGLSQVDPSLSDELSPDHAATPYEWGYLGVDSCPAYGPASQGAAGNFSFPWLAGNASAARNLIVEDPTVDITGEEFLLWQIQFYTQVLHEDWGPFWSAVGPRMTTADSWGTAFNVDFTCAPGAPQMVVSYLTDSAYAQANAPGSLESSVSFWNGTAYGWRAVYGAAIVRGTTHLGLDEAFLDYLLSGNVQAAFPTTEWEYPANGSVALPASYGAVYPTSAIHPLNAGVSPAAIATDLPGWLSRWQTLVTPPP